MELSITQAQLCSAIDRVGILKPGSVTLYEGGASIIANRCSFEAAMMLTFELASALNLRPGVPGYRELIPATANSGSDVCFNWKVKVLPDLEPSTEKEHLATV